MQGKNPINGLQVALEMERRGANLYRRAQQLTDDQELVSLLRTLEEDEKAHYQLFTRMINQYGGPPDLEESQLSAAKAGDFFYWGGLMRMAEEGALTSREAFLKDAQGVEQDSIAFYRKLLMHMDDVQQQAVISRIIREEQRHLEILQQRLSAVMKEHGNMITKESMGHLTDGREVFSYRLSNAGGAYADISTLGGCLMRLCVPDQNGTIDDVLLGYDTVATMTEAGGYMGMLIGRYANRIGGASFMLNGREYSLAKNNGENHLHGGPVGFDKKIWEAQERDGALVLTLVSPDGDEGYPGNLSVRVTYAFGDDNALRIAYEAICDQDTIVNLTNHAYFNLSGPESPSIEGHTMQIEADVITEVSSAACIPNGRLMPVDGTPFDLRRPMRIGDGLARQGEDTQMQYGRGYDHNFVIKGHAGTLRRAATVHDPASGRVMETWTDQPGVQFYSGNSIAGDTPGKLGKPYQARQGFCLETQHYPDSVHQKNFPSVVLKAGETFRTATEYRFSVE